MSKETKTTDNNQKSNQANKGLTKFDLKAIANKNKIFNEGKIVTK